jgi:hypothetical protein
MIMTDIDFLDKVQIFQGLNRKQLTAIIKYCAEAEFLPGTRIFEQGEDALYLWIVKEGRVDLRFEVAGRTSSAENKISSIPETGAFGWSSFTSPHKYRLLLHRPKLQIYKSRKRRPAAAFRRRSGYRLCSDVQRGGHCRDPV